ncbi:serine/threonine protein kinase [Burkholderiales bacterium JOSHI_001]|nr:serine/threonine protein kinase [Burkholderiales bacterium JOSHI_001]
MQDPSAFAPPAVPSMFGSLGPPVASGNALPVGTRLDEFELTAVVGEGGFGIVYKAWDHTLQREVAIKEFFPSTLAFRSQDGGQDGVQTVQVLHDADTFIAGLRSFVNEAKLLARFDHPSLLKVYRFWEANGTAYMVMPFYEGRTLKRTLIDLGAAPDEAWLRRLLRRLIDALEPMHGAQCYHRDIAPDNILVLPDGRPMLLDFGAARRVLGDKTQALTVILKPGFAPVEQYSDTADLPDMRQGPWTDLYALGAVLHFAMTGAKPPAAVARILNDHYQPLAERRQADAQLARYGEDFLHAVDCMLAVRPRDRPQNVAELRTLLGRGGDAVVSAPAPLDSLAGEARPDVAAFVSEPVPAPATVSEPAPAPAPALGPDDPPLPLPTPAPEPTREPEPTLAPEVTLAPPWVPPPVDPTPAPLPPEVASPIQPAAADGARPSGSWRGAALAVSVAGVAVAAGWFWRAGSPPAAPLPTPAAEAPAAQVAPAALPPSAAVLPPAAPVAVEVPAPPVAVEVPATLPAPTPSPVAEPGPVAAVAPDPEPARPVPRPRPRPVAPPPRTATYDPAPSPPPPRVAGRRCQDILQRVSLGEDLTAADRGYLRTECGR